MASIRERAAALNLAEKLRARAPTPGAVVLWNELVSHLRRSLTVKRHRGLLKSHGDCVLGSEVLDQAASHLSSAGEFGGAALSREAVGCVGQALLDCGVLECVATGVLGRDKTLPLFRDSKSALYRFVDGPAPSVDHLVIQKLFRTLSAGRSRDGSCTQVSAPRVPAEDTQSGLKCGASLLSLSSVAEATWQEQTLLRLLSLVELPLLEGVLQCTQTSGPSALSQRNPVSSSSSCLDRQVLQAFRESQSDAWLRAALDLLDFLPDHVAVKLSGELPSRFPPDERGSCAADIARCKTLVFGLLVKHYACAKRAPLLPRHMTDVYAAVTDLLVRAKPDSALEALQLCLKLLPPSCREELRRLLTFMALAADAAEVRLDREVGSSGWRRSRLVSWRRATLACSPPNPLVWVGSEPCPPPVLLQVENRLMVKRCFSRAILHSGSLSREKEELMVMFMLGNIQDIFKVWSPGETELLQPPGPVSRELLSTQVPAGLHKQVSDQLLSAVPERRPDPPGGAGVSSTRESTRRELWALLSSIHHDTSRSSPERKRLLGQFCQAHPEVFHQYFGDAAPGLL
ncbi:DEP domain-containing protein 7-like [Neosynchiropus ocellatus]